MTESQQLLADYLKTGSESAFRELIARYVDLVYSAAIRLVNGDAHLAQDVSQTVFVDLARIASTLSKDVMLGGWLHRHTCFVAAKMIRTERRRQLRERQSVEMNAQLDHSAANLAQVAPVLDEAINQLGSEDRAAIMLRFFEQHDFRSVGESMGSNEEAARKRVTRALDKLQALLKNRGVAFSATALGTILSAQAVTAAPAGLAMTISSAAMASAATSGATALTVLKIMSMTKLKVGIAGALVAAAITVPVLMHQQMQTQLREKDEVIRQKARQIEELTIENERLAKLSATETSDDSQAVDERARELVKLRGELGRVRQEQANAASKPPGPSALNEMMSPEMTKLIRDQQKTGLGMIYKGFANQTSLPKEQADQLNDLLADNVMENIDHITAILREGKTGAEMEQIFAAQESVLMGKVRALLGDDLLAQYQDYTRNLASSVTAEQFKSMMTGDKAEKDEKAKQLGQLMQAISQQALAEAGLSSDFQLVPTLNFQNFVSEEYSEKNLNLLNEICNRVAAQSGAFLSADELKKFSEFQAKAIGNNRMALALNRKLMSPGGR